MLVALRDKRSKLNLRGCQPANWKGHSEANVQSPALQIKNFIFIISLMSDLMIHNNLVHNNW